MLEQALELVSQGFYVFPLSPKTKIPPKGLKQWQTVATTDVEKAKNLWDSFGSDCNIGLLMGVRSGLVGLDIDLDDGASPLFLSKLPPTWTVKTGKGFHVFFKIPAHWPKDLGKISILKGNKTDHTGKKKDCISLRGNSHYFMGVGSIHPETGKAYQWAKNEGFWENLNVDLLSPDEIPLAFAPDWLLECKNTLKDFKQKKSGQKYFENQRHEMFLSTAVAMRKEGLGFDEIVARLHFRNEKDCNPPKEKCEAELKNIATWAVNTVEVLTGEELEKLKRKNKVPLQKSAEETAALVDLFDAHVKCLGVMDKDYFYITSSNRQLLRISNHSNQALLNLMPREFWMEMFPAESVAKPVDWEAAASFLIHKSLRVGLFNQEKVRGIGAWSENGKLVLHLGNYLLCEGEKIELMEFKGKNFYRLGINHPAPTETEASLTDCQILVDTCKKPSWKNPGSGILFAGQLALLRISGALPWRPHGWISGPSGCGKSTILNTLGYRMAGDWKIVPQADSTGVGIRQELEVDSLPVLFDEIESEGKKAEMRVTGVVELARQSSFESQGRIFKGTPDGRGLQYKINSMFLLASIGVNLTQEADLTRFVIYELKRPDTKLTALEFERCLDAVSDEIADRIFSRVVGRYSDLIKNYELLRARIAKLSTQRHGQQYGMLLAGYSVLVKDGVLSVVEADALISQIEIQERTSEISEESAEQTCLQRLLTGRIRFQLTDNAVPTEMPIQKIIELAKFDANVQDRMEEYGLALKNDCLIVASRSQALEGLFQDTAWNKNWNRSLVRIEGSKKDRHRFCGGIQVRVVSIPLSVTKPQNATPLHDDGVR